MHPSPRYVWYGDDFTGASDTLATVASSGLRAALFLSPPSAAQLERVGELDALGIAGTARALSPPAQRAELTQVAAFFAGLRPTFTHYKCCSTFDSAAEIGNLHVGVQALRGAEHAGPVMVLGGQPNLGRYCAFGELFATAGQDGEVHRIDRHPTMSRHPVTPMHEADLRRHLATQGLATTALIDLRQLEASETEDGTLLARLIETHASRGAQAVLFDTTSAQHLARIGRSLWQRARSQALLCLGASSCAQALIAAWPEALAASAPRATVPAADGPVFLLVGSLSPVSAAQVDAAAGSYATVDIDLVSVMASGAALERCAAQCAERLASGHPVMARTPASRVAGLASIELAQATGRLLAQVLVRAPQVRRIGLAGGDTSSWALRALAPWALQWAGSLGPGVPLLRARADNRRVDGLELVLKGGQMGPPDIFERLIKGSEASAASTGLHR
jgi:3-oxoisoapionate kinase